MKYLRSEITSDGKLNEEVKIQTYKAARVTGCLNDIELENDIPGYTRSWFVMS